MTTRTTRLPYRILWDIDYANLEFNPGEPRPSDDMYEHYMGEEAFAVLASHLETIYPGQDIFRGSNSFICYDPDDHNVRISPDYYVSIGVDSASIVSRLIYIPEEAGKPPDLVMEFASEHTARNDMRDKPAIYAAIGVSEYWRLDPTGGAYYGYSLAGDRLVNGVYQPIELTTEPDGIVKGYSRVLRISVCTTNGRLRFYNPETGLYLTGYAEERAGRRSAESEREAAVSELVRERAGRQAAEDRIRQLEEELRRLSG